MSQKEGFHTHRHQHSSKTSNTFLEQERIARKRRNKRLINALFFALCMLALCIVAAIVFAYTIDK